MKKNNTRPLSDIGNGDDVLKPCHLRRFRS